MTTLLVCAESGCPLATEGRCLEGFVPPAMCPHTSTRPDDEEGPDQGDERGLDLGGDVHGTTDDDAPVPAPSEPRWVRLGGDVALTLRDADELAARTPCRVVLVAGEFESGKTTLVVELYARFLHGPFAGAAFGGSTTLRALSARQHPARATSGRATPTTERTQDEDMRLLELPRCRGHRVAAA